MFKDCDHNCEDHSSFDFISAVHIWFISYASFTYIPSREHMNPKLTCYQRQWLHSSVGRASHRYREVTGSSPVEVLNFFQASLRNCKNCDHNCEDHSSFDFISAVHIWFISYASFRPHFCLIFSFILSFLEHIQNHGVTQKLIVALKILKINLSPFHYFISGVANSIKGWRGVFLREV